MEIDLTKPTEVSADWDDAKINVTNFNSRALNALFSAITNKEFKKISSRQPMREQRMSRIRSYKGSLQASKRLR